MLERRRAAGGCRVHVLFRMRQSTRGRGEVLPRVRRGARAACGAAARRHRPAPRGRSGRAAGRPKTQAGQEGIRFRGRHQKDGCRGRAAGDGPPARARPADVGFDGLALPVPLCAGPTGTLPVRRRGGVGRAGPAGGEPRGNARRPGTPPAGRRACRAKSARDLRVGSAAERYRRDDRAARPEVAARPARRAWGVRTGRGAARRRSKAWPSRRASGRSRARRAAAGV